MSKGNTWQKQKMSKHKANKSRAAHGSYARFNGASVDTRESVGTWYDGCDVDAKRRHLWTLDRDDLIVRPTPAVLNPRHYKQGDLHRTIAAQDAIPENRRDGGMHAARQDHKPTSVAIPADAKIKVGRPETTHKVERMGKRESLGQPLIMANYAPYNPRKTKLLRMVNGKLMEV